MELPNAGSKLIDLAEEEAFRIGQAIRIPGSNSAQDRRLVAHVADPTLARTRVSTYAPVIGSDLRCPRCWVLEEKVCLLEKTEIYRSDDVDMTQVDRSDEEYQVRCAACELLALLPFE